MIVAGSTCLLFFCLLLQFPLFFFYHKYVFSMKQYNITSDLWKCWYLLKSGWITDKRDEKRWKAKLHWRSLFRTSNRVFFSRQSAGLRGDVVVISWQRGAGHVGTTRPTSKTPELKNTDYTDALFLSLFVTSFYSYLSHFSLFLISLLPPSVSFSIGWHFQLNCKIWHFCETLTAASISKWRCGMENKTESEINWNGFQCSETIGMGFFFQVKVSFAISLSFCWSCVFCTFIFLSL